MVIFLFFTIYTEQIVWQMYMCTIELGIQNKYIELGIQNKYISKCQICFVFQHVFQGTIREFWNLKIIFYQSSVHKNKYFYL